MLHRVVKPFPCSWDGITLVDLNAGDERDFGDMAAGLVAEGWVIPAAGENAKATTPIEALAADLSKQMAPFDDAFAAAVDKTQRQQSSKRK